MSVTNTPRKAGPYTGNNTDVQYTFGFKVFADSDLVVTRAVIATGAESTLVLTTDYSVTRNANQDDDPGGYITLTAALADTYTLTLTSAVPDTQPAVFTNLGGFFPAVLNNALDRLTILVQQLKETVSRSLKLAVSTPTGFDATLPAPVAYGVLGFNGTADGFAVTDPSGSSALAEDLASTAAGKGVALVGGAASEAHLADETAPNGSRLVAFRDGLTVYDAVAALYGAVYYVADPQFGAFTGGTATQKTAAIQACMVQASTTGGRVVYPPGTHLVNGDCGCGDTASTYIRVEAFGATLQRDTTASSYTLFTFRQNMDIHGLKLLGYVASGTGWADALPGTSFGFRSSSNSAGRVHFHLCEANGFPTDGWYINHAEAQVLLTNCSGKNSYRNDIAVVGAASVVIDGGDWGLNTPAITKVAAIDIEPDSGTINHVEVKNLKARHRVDFRAANGGIRHAYIGGVDMVGANAVLDWYRVKQIEVGEIRFASGAAFGFPGAPEVSSGQTYRAQGTQNFMPYRRAKGANMLTNPYNSIEGWTASASGTTSVTPNHTIGDAKGMRVTNTGGGYLLYYQTLTVVAGEHYTLGGLTQINTAPSGGEGGLYIEMTTFGGATVWLQPVDYVVGEARYLCASIKIPTGVTSIRVGFGGSGGTQDNTFTDLFFVPGIVGEDDVQVPRITVANAAPTTGTWAVGERVVRTPVAGQPKAWSCTVVGTPGTWVSEGNL